MQRTRQYERPRSPVDKFSVRRMLCTLGAIALYTAALAAKTAGATEPHDSPATVTARAADASVQSKTSEPAGPPERGDEDKPVQLAYVEGDVAGMSSILSEDGNAVLGMIEYRQHLKGDVLAVSRIARFADGSSDEEHVRAHVGKTLRTIGGRSIIRDKSGNATVDLKIDVASRRITGFSGLGKNRIVYDEDADLTPATYWGPLIGIVLKNFEKNAVDGHLEFHTVVATPKPRVFDMELIRKETMFTRRAGGKIDVARFSLSPSINPLLDPFIRMVTPKTEFFMQAGSPPSMARFAGPRNYAGQQIRIE